MGNSSLDDLLFGRSGEDPDRAARLAGVMLIGGALVGLITLAALPSDAEKLPALVMAVIALALGLVVLRLPWSRWPSGSLVSLPVVAYVLLAVTGLLAPGVLSAYAGFYSLTFVWLGLSTKPGVPIRAVPFAAASWLIGSSHALSASVVPLLIAMPVWIVTGELLARAITDRTSRLEELAGTDSLTGLSNRRSFERVVARTSEGDAVVLIDLDHFKDVNDRGGHQMGDAILARFADALRDVTRRGDCGARYGGDEFAMVLPGAGFGGARLVLQRLDEAWSAASAEPTFSAGVAVTGPAENWTTTVNRADAALYRAKSNGRHRVEISGMDMM